MGLNEPQRSQGAQMPLCPAKTTLTSNAGAEGATINALNAMASPGAVVGRRAKEARRQVGIGDQRLRQREEIASTIRAHRARPISRPLRIKKGRLVA